MFFESYRDNLDSPTLSTPNPNNTFPDHFHKHLEILYVVAGENQVTVNGVTKTLHANQLSIADSYDVHAYKSMGDISQVLIIPYSLLGEYKTLKRKCSLKYHFITEETVALKFKAILDLLSENWEKKNTLIIKGLLFTVLGLILDNIPLVEVSDNSDIVLTQNILQYIEENFTTNITLSSIAEHFHYSKCYFSTLFKQFFHVGLNDYINLVRSHYAMNLVINKNYTIINAAMSAGFTSIPTFYRYFKNHFGISPQEYVHSKNIKDNPKDKFLSIYLNNIT